MGQSLVAQNQIQFNSLVKQVTVMLLRILYSRFFLECLTNKEASPVLCSVVKHAGSGRARKKCRGIHDQIKSNHFNTIILKRFFRPYLQ